MSNATYVFYYVRPGTPPVHAHLFLFPSAHSHRLVLVGVAFIVSCDMHRKQSGNSLDTIYPNTQHTTQYYGQRQRAKDVSADNDDDTTREEKCASSMNVIYEYMKFVLLRMRTNGELPQFCYT